MTAHTKARLDGFTQIVQIATSVMVGLILYGLLSGPKQMSLRVDQIADNLSVLTAAYMEDRVSGAGHEATQDAQIKANSDAIEREHPNE